MPSRTRCFICLEQTPILDEHHVWPQLADGSSGPTVNLCSRCHSGIHRQALNIVAVKAQRRQYFTAAQIERARPLVQYLVIALTQAREGKIPNHKTNLVIEVDSNFITMLHMLKADAGMTNLSAFCYSVLKRYAITKL